MIREFLIVEVMLPGVSGEVSGAVSVDEWSGAVDKVDCRHFDFWCDQQDMPIVLDAQQRRLAHDVVRRTLEADSELTACSDTYHGSAAAIDVASMTAMPESQKALAEYLQNVRDRDHNQATTGSQVRRSG